MTAWKVPLHSNSPEKQLTALVPSLAQLGNMRRYLPHQADLPERQVAEQRRALEDRFEGAVALFRQEFPSNSTQAVDSTGKRKDDYTLYTGFTGNLLLYSKLNQYSSAYTSDLQQALSATLATLQVVKDPLDPPAFYTGATGPLVLAAVLHHSPALVTRILAYESKLPLSQFDLLYGAPGYMYSLVYLLTHWKDCPLQTEVVAALGRSAEVVGEAGNREEGLKFPFPKRNGLEYVGAAHGSLGAVQALLLAQPWLERDYREVIRRTLDLVVRQQTASGALPTVHTDTETDLVHFCHGATGAVSPLCLASRLLSNPQYLQAAERAGEDVWQRGLLLKGRGVCHGSSGSAYALLALYRATSQPAWLHRAIAMAYWSLLDPAVVAACAAYDDPMRLRIGSPDTPYSLMEGQAGALCLWHDVLHPEASALPGYEL